MARKKIKPACRLKSWSDVDGCMMQVAQCERILADLDTDMNRALDETKARYAMLAKPVQEKIDHYSADICQYVTENRGGMESKTKELNFGRTGFRISTKLKYNKGVKAAEVCGCATKPNGCMRRRQRRNSNEHCRQCLGNNGYHFLCKHGHSSCFLLKFGVKK